MMIQQYWKNHFKNCRVIPKTTATDHVYYDAILYVYIASNSKPQEIMKFYQNAYSGVNRIWEGGFVKNVKSKLCCS